MELPEAEEQATAGKDDNTMMRFYAAMMDKLLKKLDELIDAVGRHEE